MPHSSTEVMRSSSRLAGIVPRLSPDNSTMAAKASSSAFAVLDQHNSPGIGR